MKRVVNMASRVVKKKKNPTPGPQSADMIHYLEGLANGMCISQLKEPCSTVALSSTFSDPRLKTEVVLNTMDRYIFKK